ncbi:MAG: membrane protein insertase YidC [Actinobacteria bacterium]|nr:membrane protein insertase YidC [Actinomycetota bacterium]
MNPLRWLELGVSYILRAFHSLFSNIFPFDSGAAWGFAIVGLVIVIRILIIPLFVKQIRSTQNMQVIQPQVKEIQKKYAGDRERQSQELMKLYRETGTNPLASCLPILAQSPIFFALFSVLNGIGHNKVPPGMTAELVDSMRNATYFGAPLYGTFVNAGTTDSPGLVRVVTLILVVLMTATTFMSQKMMIVKNTAPDNPMVQQQKIMLYVFPVLFAVSGVNFPIGVLTYWLTTNLWSMGQQIWLIRNSPQPDTPAHAAMLARKAAKAAKRGEPAAPGGADAEQQAVRMVRQQPKRKSRSERRGGPTTPGQTGSTANSHGDDSGSDGTESSDTQDK